MTNPTFVTVRTNYRDIKLAEEKANMLRKVIKKLKNK
ncbi:hypothetical protein ES705_04834 [subsurface metagenome]